jgi:hypothetical protein
MVFISLPLICRPACIKIYVMSTVAYTYCTAVFNVALGVTCNLSTKLYLLAELTVTCDQPKVLVDHIFGGMLLPHREEIFLINHFVTLRASGRQPWDAVTPAKLWLGTGVCDL